MLRRQLLHQIRILLHLLHLILRRTRMHKLIMQRVRQQRIRQRTEVRLEHGRDAADIIELVRVVEVEGSVVAALEELGDDLGLAGAAGLAVDAFVVDGGEFDGLDAFLDDDGDHAAISPGVCPYLFD